MTYKVPRLDVNDRLPDTLVPERLTEASLSNTTATAIAPAAAPTPRRGPVNRSIITRFDPGHGWAMLGTTAASVTDDTTDYALGTQSLAWTTKTDGTAASVQKSGLGIDATGKTLRIWIKFDAGGTPSNIDQIAVYAGDASLAAFWVWDIFLSAIEGTKQIKEGEWFPITLPFTAPNTGTPNRANIDMIRVRGKALNGASATFKLGGISLVDQPNDFPNGVVSFECDDLYPSQWTVMRKKLAEYGYPATCNVIVDRVDDPLGLTLAQLHDLEDVYGWEVSAHAYTTANHGVGYANMTDADLHAELRAMKNWLKAENFKAADHLAWPLGSFDPEAIAVAKRYFNSARTVVKQHGETIVPADPMRIRTFSVADTTTAAEVKTLIDNAYTYGHWLVLTLHDLVTTPASQVEWHISRFEEVIDYIATKGIPVRTTRAVLDTPGPPVVPTVPAATANLAMNNTAARVHAVRREAVTSEVPPTAGTAFFSCFTPVVDVTTSTLCACTGATAWAGSTLTRMGLYTVDVVTGAFTLVAATANDTALFTAPNTVYRPLLSTGGGLPAAYTLLAGQRYAVAVLGVGRTAGTLISAPIKGRLSGRQPFLTGTSAAGLTDLPASGTLTAADQMVWFEVG